MMTPRFVTGLALAVGVSACATYDPATDTRTEVDKAIGRCMAAVAIGAIGGAILGNNTGDGNAGRGAVLGAGLGAGACAVMMAVAGEKDKQRIAMLQQQSFEQGAPQSQSYVGDDNRQRTILTTVSNAPSVDVEGETLICRRVATTITVQGAGAANVPGEIKCRGADGSWNRPPPPNVSAT